MHRFVLFPILTAFLLNLCACSQATISKEQSEKNFENYSALLQAALEVYDLELKEESDTSNENEILYRDFCVFINSAAEIKIRIINSAFETDKGTESFSIDYFLYNSNAPNEFDIALFVDLANCISGKEISTTACHNFLVAPESKYAAEKYGYKKQGGEIVAKMYPLNFAEDWVFCYFKTENKEQLSFGGLTGRQ